MKDIYIIYHNCLLRGHFLKPTKPLCASHPRKHFLLFCVTNLWNSLLETVISAPTVKNLKLSKLDLINILKMIIYKCSDIHASAHRAARVLINNRLTLPRLLIVALGVSVFCYFYLTLLHF